MADGNGKIKKVEVYITSDGRVFTDEKLAKEHQEEIDFGDKVRVIYDRQTKILQKNANTLTKINGYYRMVNGEFFGTNDVYDALTSLIVDTPEDTKKLIQSIEDGAK